MTTFEHILAVITSYWDSIQTQQRLLDIIHSNPLYTKLKFLYPDENDAYLQSYVLSVCLHSLMYGCATESKQNNL